MSKILYDCSPFIGKYYIQPSYGPPQVGFDLLLTIGEDSLEDVRMRAKRLVNNFPSSNGQVVIVQVIEVVNKD
jgi:hypothetical protein